MTETITTATARVVEQLTREAVEPREVEPGLYLAPDAETGSRVIDVRDQIERTKDHPRRKTGAVTLAQHDSFTAYLTKHGMPETELWADIDKDRITAVINAHAAVAGDPDDEGVAGWGDHRATLQLVTTQDWRDWTGNSGNLVGQQEFAEFVEQHVVLPIYGLSRRRSRVRALGWDRVRARELWCGVTARGGGLGIRGG